MRCSSCNILGVSDAKKNPALASEVEPAEEQGERESRDKWPSN
jgi:hypothetical protein